MLLTTQFQTPLTYEAALARVDEFYDQQVGRKAAAAFPEIAPKQHFDLWHDMWVSFDASKPASMQRHQGHDQTPRGRHSARLAKGWMLNLAGRMDAARSARIQEEPALHSVEGDLYGGASMWPGC